MRRTKLGDVIVFTEPIKGLYGTIGLVRHAYVRAYDGYMIYGVQYENSKWDMLMTSKDLHKDSERIGRL